MTGDWAYWQTIPMTLMDDVPALRAFLEHTVAYARLTAHRQDVVLPDEWPEATVRTLVWVPNMSTDEDGNPVGEFVGLDVAAFLGVNDPPTAAEIRFVWKDAAHA